jgi:hypothetical protein
MDQIGRGHTRDISTCSSDSARFDGTGSLSNMDGRARRVINAFERIDRSGKQVAGDRQVVGCTLVWVWRMIGVREVEADEDAGERDGERGYLSPSAVNEPFGTAR